MNLTAEEKKALRKEYREKQKKKYILNESNVRSLFDYVSARLDKSDCDHTLRHTQAWLTNKYAEETVQQQILEEIREDGGYCDCEVILNCYERYEL